jgi:hypothetical protein
MALFVPLVLASVSGCGGSNVDPYPESLIYPQRTDLIVKKVPGDGVPTPDDPGQLDHWIAAISTKAGGETVDPNLVPANLRQDLQKELEKVFGRPARPRVDPMDPDPSEQATRQEQANNLQLTPAVLAEGSKNYRRHCMHCHGVPGNGRGPTGPWLNPHPRDYRQGIFKFVSSQGDSAERKPRREDILRTLRRGIDGTSMPSFGLESPEVLNTLVSYVIHLSLRGEVEMKLLEAICAGDNTIKNLEDQSIAAEIQLQLGKALKGWTTSTNAEPNQPPKYEYTEQDLHDSIARGWGHFTNEKTFNCIKCHIDYGRQSLFLYDVWGTMARPNNLTAGLYRGGRRPIDIFWRVRGGIPGCGMPGKAPPDGGDAKAKKDYDESMWDVVNFVLYMPYPKMLPDKIREKVYPEPKSGHAPEKHAAAN